MRLAYILQNQLIDSELNPGQHCDISEKTNGKISAQVKFFFYCEP